VEFFSIYDCINKAFGSMTTRVVDLGYQRLRMAWRCSALYGVCNYVLCRIGSCVCYASCPFQYPHTQSKLIIVVTLRLSSFVINAAKRSLQH
jgi:hypothetical protein